MPELAIQARGLGKAYRRYRRPVHRLWEAMTRRPLHSEVVALAGVDFEVPAGEGLGIIGENGAGKSTLLKLLCGVTQPSSGSFRVDGKVAAILELGAGFHPEFSGRENAVLNAALLGLSETEVAAALPRILDFCELGSFIDEPVKTYSTGMAMRLAFSIATQVEPQVLIIDEALSVGDGYFQKKCMDRMRQFVDGGGTVLFCSHAMYYVSALCGRALWLRHGKVAAYGPALAVIGAYEDYLLAKQTAAAEHGEPRTTTASPARITGVRQIRRGPSSEIASESGGYRHGERFELEVEWRSDDARLGFAVGVGINRLDGVEVCAFGSNLDGVAVSGGEGDHRLRLVVPELPLVKGTFTLFVY
ncbi:MAG TPA: ABC transporter ATP-binding protein, partial [Thermoanaerobaculia bacterium]|nr:ABC transporter ATP-binding protein [Thermoanaerobaculia bacterium]